ncbi:MAG: adenosylcobinamide-GDP ribazoletransferase [Methanomicrobiales archaeon]
MFLKSIIALLQFCTVLPLGKPQEFECFAKRTWLYPLAGYVTGGFAAVVSFWIVDPAIAAAIAIAGLFLITGCNHFDGLLDLGDGLMAHGGRERRIGALTDRQIGTGAFALAVTIVLITWAGLQAVYPIIWVLVLSEVCAKFSMALLTVTGKPFRQGIHAYLHEQSHPRFILYAAILCLPLVLFPVAPLKLAAAAVLMVIVPLVLLAISSRTFGGINGDIVGASNEITRAMVIIAFVLI